MAAPRLTTLAIKGLVTTPNEYGVYPEGSCQVLENWRAASLNQWTVIRNRFQIIQSGVTNDRIKRLAALSPGVFITIQSNSLSTTWSIYRNGDSANNFTVKFPLTLTSLFNAAAGYVNPVVARAKLFINSLKGVVVLDKLAPANAGEREFRAAGLSQPTFYSSQPNTGDAIPNNTVVSYTVLVRRTSADGYSIVSAPMIPLRVLNATGGAREFTITVSWALDAVGATGGEYVVGDVLELYRSSGLSSTNYDADPGTSMRLVASRELTSADCALRRAGLADRQPMVSPLYETSGAEIYTSPYQDGSLGANLPPPICKTMAQWGDYTFYGNITDEPNWLLDVPAGVFDSSSASVTAWVRKNGIGLRRLSGVSFSIGSPTVTGVSAADIVGIVPGQVAWSGVGWASGVKVVAVGATTITMASNATANGAATVMGIADVLEINGVEKPISRIVDLVTDDALSGSYLFNDMAYFPSETLPTGGYSSLDYAVGVTILFRPKRVGIYSTLSIRASNGGNYSPALPEISATAKVFSRTERPNFWQWSRQGQPEAVPTSNTARTGSGALIRFLATTDCIWALCTDGAYRISGEAGVWRADLIDPTFVPVSPDACCVLNDVVYAYTARGFCSLAGITTSLITRGVLDAEFPGQPFTESSLIHLCANTVTEEIMVIFEAAAQGGDSVNYLYSTLYKQWSTIVFSDNKLTAGASAASATAGIPNYMVFGAQVSGGPPKTFSWDDNGIAAQALRPSPAFTLQPLYAGDPLALKRWIDATWIFNNVQFTYVLQGVNGELTTTTVALLRSSNSVDSRASLGISRLGAIGASLRISGFVSSNFSDVPPVLKGLSLRYVPLTTQQKFR
jgi:hypothetical protein